MTSFILYQLKVAFCLALFTGLYFLWLRKETFHTINRFYLTGSLLLSAIIPLIDLPVLSGVTDEPVLSVLNPVVVQAGMVNDSPAAKDIPILKLIYNGFVIVFALSVLYQIGRLIFLVCLNQYKRTHSCRVYYLTDSKHSFSFFNFIFIASGEHDQQVLRHELAHAQQYHSIDIILTQFVKIFQWFNPFIYLLSKALQETHEYLADKAVLEHDGEPDRYRMLLVTQAFGIRPGIVNFFNYSLIKNRLIMLTKERSLKRYYLKYLSVVPLIIMALAMLSTQAVSQDSDKNQKLDASQESNAAPEASSQKNGEPIFVYVEKDAFFQGQNIEKFREWVQKQLVYPPDAIKNKMQGRIVMQFIINSDGKMGNIKVLRGVDPMLDNEALRVVKLSPDWTPAQQGGKNVTQQFVMPVIFSLQSSTDIGKYPSGKNELLKFQGSQGDAALEKFREWVQNKVIYPKEAISNGIQGEILFQYTILPSGKMGEVKIVKGVHPLLDEELLRVVKSSPDWDPFPRGEDKALVNLMTFTFKLN